MILVCRGRSDGLGDEVTPANRSGMGDRLCLRLRVVANAEARDEMIKPKGTSLANGQSGVLPHAI